MNTENMKIGTDHLNAGYTNCRSRSTSGQRGGVKHSFHSACRNIGVVFSGLLFWLGVVPSAFAEPSPDWKDLARNAQPALFTLVSDAETPFSMFFDGFFISKEGHAICDLRALTLKSLPPQLWISDKKFVPKITILEVFPAEALALLKLNIQPKKWLVISDQAPPLGTEVAVLGRNHVPPSHIGPILAKWKTRELSRIGGPFVDRLSIGTVPPGVDNQGADNLRQGFPLIDRDGSVRGAVATWTPSFGQILVLASPLDPLARKIAEAITRNRKIDFPLPAGMNSIDPLVMSTPFVSAVTSMMNGETNQALGCIDQLLKKHPASRSLRKLQVEILRESERWADLRTLLDELSKGGDRTGFDKVDLLYEEALLIGSTDPAKAIPILTKLISMTPADYPEPRIMLGDCYRLMGKQSGDLTAYLQAVESYKAAMAVSPERIDLLTSYEQVLNHLKRWKEADALSERIIQLEAIYRKQ